MIICRRRCQLDAILDVIFDVPGEKRGIGEAGKCISARHVNPGRGPFLAVATSRQPSATRIPSRAGIQHIAIFHCNTIYAHHASRPPARDVTAIFAGLH